MYQIQTSQNLMVPNAQPQPTIEDELHDFYEDKIFDFISD